LAKEDKAAGRGRASRLAEGAIVQSWKAYWLELVQQEDKKRDATKKTTVIIIPGA
jgi:hypothetical protein